MKVHINQFIHFKKLRSENQFNLLEEEPEPIEIIECKDINEFLQILEEIYQGKRKIKERRVKNGR